MYVTPVGSFVHGLDASLRDVMAAIQESGPAACCLVENGGCFLNILTDGDLRRALLAGLSLESCVAEALRLKTRAPITVSVEAPDSSVVAVMKRFQLRQIPVLDAGSHVVAVAVLSESMKLSCDNTSAVIMAGGLGSRLGVLTKTCPKPMLPVAGKPILQHVIEKLFDHGVDNFFIAVNYLADQIEDYFESGAKFNVKITYLREKEKLGTAGALSLIPKSVVDNFIVTNGDVLTSVDYSALKCFHDRNKANITVCSVPYQVDIPFGVLDIKDRRVLGLLEKPTMQYQVSAGVYFLSNSVVRSLSGADYLDMPDLINRYLSSGSLVSCFPIIENWADIGTPEQYSQAISLS
jgi:dTDP-glucose pyrophosphorylase